jgi:hypothetical protein
MGHRNPMTSPRGGQCQVGKGERSGKGWSFSIMHSWSTGTFPEHYNYIFCGRVSFDSTLFLREDCWEIFDLLGSKWLSLTTSSRMRGHRGSNFQ